MRKISVAQRNVLILILSLMPFIVGIGISLYKSSDRAFFGVSINISGSQRMRTMLIANYTQQIEDNFLEGNQKELDEINKFLSDELKKYEKFMTALVEGDKSLNMKANKYPEIVAQIKFLRPLFNQYIMNAKAVMNNPADKPSVKFIVQHALELKNHIHKTVEMYQSSYDSDVNMQRKIDITMITIAVTVTLFGFLLSRIIGKNEYNANFDFLTKLQNRHNLYEYIKNKNVPDFIIYFIDLNKFKIINDTYGHGIGDEILVEVANRLRKVFGSETLYRYGGDEFVVLKKKIENSDNNINHQHIDTMINQLTYELTKPVIDSLGREHFAGLSMGVVANNVGIEDWFVFFNFADELMCESKSIPEHVIVCNKKEEVESRMYISGDVSGAIKNGEIFPIYQPVYRGADESVGLYNVLSRWKYKDRIIMPSEFLPLFKRRGLLHDFDKFTIREADKKYSEMLLVNPNNANIFYSVNITEDTLLRADKNGLYEVLEAIAMPKSQLVLKFLEDVLLNNSNLKILDNLVKRGFTIAVDNFTIDSSLRESTKHENISIIKIGHSLVLALQVDEYSKKMLQEFVKLLLSVGKIVIVEGIDKINEIELLKSINTEKKENLMFSRHIDEIELLKPISTEKKENLMFSRHIVSPDYPALH